MTWTEQQRHYKNRTREAERLSADAADRELHPENWQPAEIPAIWDRGDLYEGDHKRDNGCR